MVFPQSLLDALWDRPDRPAFEHGSRIVSRGEVLAVIGRLTAALRGLGLGRGCGVAMITSVSPEAFAANIAAHALGCRVVGVRPGWSTRQLAGVLTMRIDVVIVDSLTMTPELLGLTGHTRIVSLGSCPGLVDLLTCPGDGSPVTAQARASDMARLTFTSGSTGRPKGCAQTYGRYGVAFQPDRWPAPVAQLAAALERCLVFGTLSSPVMMIYAGRSLLAGGTVIIPVDDQRPLFPHAIERYRVTGTITTVPRFHQLLKVLGKDPVDVSSLRALVVSGSPVNPARFAAGVERLGPVLWQDYGQTEAGVISLLTPDDIAELPANALTSVGRPLPGVDVSIRDQTGVPVPTGEIGEICVRSPHVMVGYWGDRQQTEEVLRDGWLHTRDLGYLDERRFLQMTGRSRDVIMVNAEVVYAGPIERVLAGHPDVDQAYVVGASDEVTGEAIHAFVVPNGDRMPERSILAGLVSGELGPAAVPKTITWVAEVPIAASGKPDKRALLSQL